MACWIITAGKPSFLLLKSNLKRNPLLTPTSFKLSFQHHKVQPPIQLIGSNKHDNKLLSFDSNRNFSNVSIKTTCNATSSSSSDSYEVTTSNNKIDKTTWEAFCVGFVFLVVIPLAGFIGAILREPPEMAMFATLIALFPITMVVQWYNHHAPMTHSTLTLQADVEWGIIEAFEQHNRLSTEERTKFDDETHVDVNNIQMRSSTHHRSDNGFSNEGIVVTIIVTAKGKHSLSTINSGVDLNEALEKLASFPSNKIEAIEILWTPLSKSNVLSEQELLKDYPHLCPL
ncbi:OLC1v1001904C1 [Oldenlandia corymbosa var. corymbosa]|uniref:OLC1v1001904C1 n=1 Tax=Oldenlandia corymbosa var. corymbosa TaxID=529605 RepID=A0AAV1D6L4_OLDCO|nr:OLC1v1001904C1 [Oldenlandia corymbosa var. corymbosa]